MPFNPAKKPLARHFFTFFLKPRLKFRTTSRLQHLCFVATKLHRRPCVRGGLKSHQSVSCHMQFKITGNTARCSPSCGDSFRVLSVGGAHGTDGWSGSVSPGCSTWESDSLCGVCQVWKQQSSSCGSVDSPSDASCLKVIFLHLAYQFLCVGVAFFFFSFLPPYSCLLCCRTGSNLQGETFFFSCLFMASAHLLMFNSL